MKQIRLTKGLYALVDDEDFDFVNQWSWYASHESRGTKFYAIRREGGIKIRMHREIVGHRGVTIPTDFVVDHINHNSLDNRFSINLEVVSQAENMRRSPGWKRKGVKSGGRSNSVHSKRTVGNTSNGARRSRKSARHDGRNLRCGEG